MASAPVPGESRSVDRRFQYTRKVNRFGGEYKPGDAYSSEQRQRVVDEYQFRASMAGENRPHGLAAQIAKEQRIDPKTVQRWVAAWENEQRLDPLARGTTVYEKAELGHVLYLKEMLDSDPTRYVWELREMMAADLEGIVRHPRLSETTVWRLIKDNLGYSYKKVSEIALQQLTQENDARRLSYHAEVHQYRREEMLVADETAISYNTGWRRGGWAPAQGTTRAVDARPKIYAPSYSCVGFVSVEGFEHVEIKKGAVTGEDWWQCICDAEPVFASGKYRALVLDNASIHRMMDDQVRWFLKQYGITLIYLPPYSPDLSPIEEAFSKVKLSVQDGREDIRRDMEPEIIRGFESVTAIDCSGYFRWY